MRREAVLAKAADLTSGPPAPKWLRRERRRILDAIESWRIGDYGTCGLPALHPHYADRMSDALPILYWRLAVVLRLLGEPPCWLSAEELLASAEIAPFRGRMPPTADLPPVRSPSR